MEEAGIIQKEKTLRYPSPPECFQQILTISASYHQIIIGVGILCSGIFLSMLQLLLEIIWFRYKTNIIRINNGRLV